VAQEEKLLFCNRKVARLKSCRNTACCGVCCDLPLLLARRGVDIRHGGCLNVYQHLETKEDVLNLKAE
jgi:hypothetical protein